ncbi:MAG: hypothetical protein IPH41_05130 [Sulfuritalea sp.]|nr:hypothetical protein [Sulfuritalea sp.]
MDVHLDALAAGDQVFDDGFDAFRRPDELLLSLAVDQRVAPVTCVAMYLASPLAQAVSNAAMRSRMAFSAAPSAAVAMAGINTDAITAEVTINFA